MISVGIDIGAFSIKVAELEVTSRSYAIRRIQEFPLSLDLTKDKKIEIIDTLRTLFQQYNLEQTQFVFASPQKYVSTRSLRLPFRERFKVQKAVVSQLEDELPFSQEDAIFDAKITRYAGKGADILAMAVPKERIKELVDLAHDCGVEPNIISTDAMGINNLFERWAEPPAEGLSAEQEIPSARQAEVVINVGHTSTDLLVYAEGMLLATRNIDWGAKNIADMIGNKYGLNYLQAMRELQTKGYIMLDKAQGTREQVVFSETIEAAVTGLVAELRLKLYEVQSEFNLQWTKGHMLGGGAQLKNLGAFLTQHLEFQFNKFKQFDVHPPIAFETNPHLELASATAVGLAIEGLRRPRNPATSFLKGEFAQQSNMFEAAWQKWGYTAQLAGIGFVILIAWGMMRESLAISLLEKSEDVLKTQAQAIAGLKGGKATQSKIEQFIRHQENMAKGRKKAEQVLGLNSALDILTRISSSIPKDPGSPIEVKRVSINNDMAEVQGYTSSNAQKDTILKALQKVAAGTVSATDLRITAPAGMIGFAYKFKVNRFGG